MKLAFFVLFLFLAGIAHAVEFGEVIPLYLNTGEDYSTFELYSQTPAGVELANALVLVRGAPVFVLDVNGSLVEDEQVILSVSVDYVNSRPVGSQVASAESK